MTDFPDPPELPEDDALAAEYVLGLLDTDDRAAAEMRLNRDPAFTRRVRFWEASFASMAEDLPPVPARGWVKMQLMERMVADFTPKRPPQQRAWWPVGLAVAASLALLVLVAVPRGPGPLEPAQTAVLAAEDRSLVVSVGFAPDENTLLVTREAGGARPGRVLQLWTLPQGDTAPISLGVLPEDRETVIALPEGLAARLGGALLEISDEPPGGSPLPRPTGDVLAIATLADA